MYCLVLWASLFIVSSANAQKNYSIEEFLKAPDEELTQHKKELDTLIKQKKLNIPQSQAMLFYPDPILNRQRLQKQFAPSEQRPEWALPPLTEDAKKALNKAMKTEKESNLVLYHSTLPNLYAQSYINTQLRKLALELQGKKIDIETLLMRDLNKPRSYEEEKAKRKKLLVHGLHGKSDSHKEGAEYVVATNPAITSGERAESSLFYFLKKIGSSYKIQKAASRNPQKVLPLYHPKDNTLLDQTIKEKENELSDTMKEFNSKTNTSVLLQFNVKDDNLARKVIYNSYPGGNITYTTLRGKIASTPEILKSIQQDPQAFYKDNIQEQQMRLVVSGDKLLDLENPAVKEFDVKAYSGSDQSLKEFQQKVDASIQKIRSDYFAKKQQMSWPRRIQYGARDLFYRRQSPWEQRQQYKRMLQGNIGSPFE